MLAMFITGHGLNEVFFTKQQDHLFASLKMTCRMTFISSKLNHKFELAQKLDNIIWD